MSKLLVRIGGGLLATAAAFAFASGPAFADDITEDADGAKCTPSIDPPLGQPGQASSGTAGGSGQAFGSLAGEAINEASHSGDKVKAWLHAYAECYPDKNIMIIQDDTPQEVSDLSGKVAEDNVKIATHTFSVYVFDEGKFKNSGDLGWRNWGFYGNYERKDDGKVVEFSD